MLFLKEEPSFVRGLKLALSWRRRTARQEALLLQEEKFLREVNVFCDICKGSFTVKAHPGKNYVRTPIHNDPKGWGGCVGVDVLIEINAPSENKISPQALAWREKPPTDKTPTTRVETNYHWRKEDVTPKPARSISS